jgi:hypothetical protein
VFTLEHGQLLTKRKISDEQARTGLKQANQETKTKPQQIEHG